MEAGVEEALTQIYYNDITQLGNNQWTYSDGLYHKKVTWATTAANTMSPLSRSIACDCFHRLLPGAGEHRRAMGGQTAFGLMLGAVTGSSTPL